MKNMKKNRKKEYSETTPEINDSIKSKISKGITEYDVIINLLARKSR